MKVEDLVILTVCSFKRTKESKWERGLIIEDSNSGIVDLNLDKVKDYWEVNIDNRHGSFPIITNPHYGEAEDIIL